MKTCWNRCWFAVALSVLAACGGSPTGATLEPLPVGSGLYFTDGNSGFEHANFYRVNTVSGDTSMQAVGDGTASSGIAQCPAMVALDLRPDGRVLAVAKRTAVILEADPRSTLCRQLASLPEPMRALAVHTDGGIYTVSATNKLYQLEPSGKVVSSTVLLCSGLASTCPVMGIDFGPDGTLYAIVSSGLWSRVNPASGQLTTVKFGVGLSDDFDIDTLGQVRGLAGNEVRSIDLAGNSTGYAINVFGGTASATGVVYR